MRRSYQKPAGPEVVVEDSCGCIFCDLDLEPGWRIKTGTMEYYHRTRHGEVPCTNPIKPVL